MLQSENFVPIYEEIASVIGEEETVKLYKKFRGQQITFPQRLYNTDYVAAYVKELAREFEYPERRVREFLKI